jgi:uncharacterized sulfatase
MMYEEVVRVPLIISGAGTPAGWTVKRLCSHIDIVPTVLSFFGLDVPEALPGRSLLPVSQSEIEEERTAEDEHRTADIDSAVMMQFFRFGVFHDGLGEWYPIRALVTKEWKLVINLFDQDELYHLANDPHEEHNLLFGNVAVEDRAAARDLLRLLNSEMERTFDPLRGPVWRDRSWTKGPVAENHTFFRAPEHQPKNLASKGSLCD